MSRSGAVRACAVTLFLSLAVPAWAGSPYWDDVLEPARRRQRLLLELGQTCLVRARAFLDPVLGGRDEANFERLDALRYFDEATRLMPGDPLGHFHRAKALQELDREAEAIRVLSHARTLPGADQIESDIVFQLAIAYTVVLDLPAALREYDRALLLAITPSERSTVLSNAAEVLMMMERLPEAIARYEEAIADAVSMRSPVSQTRALAHYGLAVALDRDEQRARALQQMREGWAQDPQRNDEGSNGGSLLHPAVFFVPDYERYYYLGLLFEARAETTVDVQTREDLRAEAETTWRAYLALGGARGRWARLAEAHAAPLAPRGGRGRARPAQPEDARIAE